MAAPMFVPNNKCSVCGHAIERPVPVSGPDRRPRAGSFVICVECGNVMVYGPDLSLRDPTPDERQRALDSTDALPRGELKAKVETARKA